MDEKLLFGLGTEDNERISKEEVIPGTRDLHHLAGYRTPLTVQSLALQIIDDIRLGVPETRSFRLIRQFVMDFERACDDKALLLECTPPLTGVRYIDSMIAGLAEHLAFHSGLKVPAWTREADRYMKLPWFGFQLEHEVVHVHAMLRGPISLRNHGIFIDSSSFVNI